MQVKDDAQLKRTLLQVVASASFVHFATIRTDRKVPSIPLCSRLPCSGMAIVSSNTLLGTSSLAGTIWLTGQQAAESVCVHFNKLSRPFDKETILE